jgi:hypothetical protein
MGRTVFSAMRHPKSKHPVAASLVQTGIAALLFTLGPATAQNDRQPAPPIPVDLPKEPPAPARIPAAIPVTDTDDAKSEPAEPVTDYATRIGNGLKERERRLTLLNEAMMKLREAGEMEDAKNVELRIRALLEMPAPSQVDAKLKTEIEQLKAKNEELALQIVNLQEELKRSKAPASGSRRGMASSDR